jgi:hypothetical protein
LQQCLQQRYHIQPRSNRAMELRNHRMPRIIRRHIAHSLTRSTEIHPDRSHLRIKGRGPVQVRRKLHHHPALDRPPSCWLRCCYSSFYRHCRSPWNALCHWCILEHREGRHLELQVRGRRGQGHGRCRLRHVGCQLSSAFLRPSGSRSFDFDAPGLALPSTLLCTWYQGHEHTNHMVRLPLALAFTVHICAKHHAGVSSTRSYTPDYGVNISKWLMAYIRRKSKGQPQNSLIQIYTLLR